MLLSVLLQNPKYNPSILLLVTLPLLPSSRRKDMCQIPTGKHGFRFGS